MFERSKLNKSYYLQYVMKIVRKKGVKKIKIEHNKGLFAVIIILDVLGGVPSSVVTVTVLDIAAWLPRLSVVFIAKVYCVEALRLPTVIPVVEGVGSDPGSFAPAHCPSINVAPATYLTS